MTYNERLHKLMSDARSEVERINPEDKYKDVKYIMALNKSIKKINTLKDEMLSERRRLTLSNWNTNKKTAV